MGRKKINSDKKKQHLSIVVSQKNFDRIIELELNNSKFINELLKEYFDLYLKGANNA